MLVQHVVVEIRFFGGHDHARRAGQRVVEPRDPALTARRHAGAHEILPVKRKHDVYFGADVLRFLDADQVGAARGRRVEDRRVQPRELLAQCRRHRRFQRGREARLGSIRRVDHVAGEREHLGGREHFQHIAASGSARARRLTCRRIDATLPAPSGACAYAVA